MNSTSPKQIGQPGATAQRAENPRQKNHRPMGAWIALASLGVVLLVAIAVVVTVLVLGSNEGREDTSSAPATSAAAPSTPARSPAPVMPSKPVAPVEPSTAIIPLGSPIVSSNYSLVIDTVEILDQIETVSGTPIVAPPGTKLVLVHSTISITGNAQDLTCGSSIFMQAHDSMGAEMAHVFEGPEIPGNPQCNYKTSAGETTSWNFAFKIAADRTPGTLDVTDTNIDGQYNWGETLVASLS